MMIQVESGELLILRLLAQRVEAIPGLCDWRNPAFDTPGSHLDWHHGSPCPYESVVPAYLKGHPDPRRKP